MSEDITIDGVSIKMKRAGFVAWLCRVLGKVLLSKHLEDRGWVEGVGWGLQDAFGWRGGVANVTMIHPVSNEELAQLYATAVDLARPAPAAPEEAADAE